MTLDQINVSVGLENPGFKLVSLRILQLLVSLTILIIVYNICYRFITLYLIS